MAMLVITRVSLWTLPAESSTRLASQYHGGAGASPFVQSSSFSLGTVPWSNGQFIDIDQLIKRIPQNGALAPSLQIDFLPEVRRWNYMKVTTWHWTSGESSFKTESNRVWKNTTSALLFEHQDLLDFCRVLLQVFCQESSSSHFSHHESIKPRQTQQGRTSLYHTWNRRHRNRRQNRPRPSGPTVAGSCRRRGHVYNLVTVVSVVSSSCVKWANRHKRDSNGISKCKLQNVLQTQLRDTSCIVHSYHS